MCASRTAKVAPMKMSSVVLRQPARPGHRQKDRASIRWCATKWSSFPITHVFTPDQHLYLQYEVYDPAKGKKLRANRSASRVTDQQEAAKPPQPQSLRLTPFRVLTSIESFRAPTKVMNPSRVVPSLSVLAPKTT